MASELRLFLCAVQFLTRLPTPQFSGFAPEWIARASRYFSVVGQIVGALGAAVLIGAEQLWTGWLPAVLALAATIVIAGALHEDGLADTADGLAGGDTPGRRLEIMKDSRVGSYGALALLFSVMVRVAGLSILAPGQAAWTLIAMQGLGRAAAVGAMRLLPYAGDPVAAKAGATARPGWGEVAAAVLVSMWPLAILPIWAGIAGVLVGLWCAALLGAVAGRLIGGRTGDVLGAIEQVTEIGFVLAAAAVLAR